MWPYFLVTGIIVLAAILYPRQHPYKPAWIAAIAMVVLFTGLRHHVGMDWNNYLWMSQYMEGRSLLQAFDRAEPGYALLLWTSTKLGWGVYGANLVGAIIFGLGLSRCARATSAPWLALAVSMPMLVVVVSMSANRQALAIGVLLWLVGSWQESSFWKRVIITMLATSFHFSAIFFLMFVALDVKMRPAYKHALGILMVAAVVAFLQFSGASERYDQVYVGGQSALTFSPGATQHVLFNGLPALAVFMRRGLRDKLLPNQLLVRMAWLSLALMPLAFVFSAAAGRMTLYMFPVSMFVLSGFTRLLVDRFSRAAVRTFVGIFMLAVLGYWLVFANSSRAHIPYENALFVPHSKLAL